METFHKVVIGIAIVVLIILLIAVGFLLNKTKDNMVYPPSANKCPDYWLEDNDGCKMMNDNNKGDLNSNDVDITTDPVVNFDDKDANNYYLKSVGKSDPGPWYNEDKETFSEYSDICAKQAWANHYNVKWDGVKNYNGCY